MVLDVESVFLPSLYAAAYVGATSADTVADAAAAAVAAIAALDAVVAAAERDDQRKRI
jgi:hypothetical protein